MAAMAGLNYEAGSVAEIHAPLAPGILMTAVGEQLGVSAATVCRRARAVS